MIYIIKLKLICFLYNLLDIIRSECFAGGELLCFFVIIKVYYGKSPAIDDGAFCLLMHFNCCSAFFRAAAYYAANGEFYVGIAGAGDVGSQGEAQMMKKFDSDSRSERKTFAGAVINHFINVIIYIESESGSHEWIDFFPRPKL